MAEEEIAYDQIEAGGDPDPLGLRQKLKAVKTPAADPLGLRAKLTSNQQPTPQPQAFQINLSQPSFKAAPAQVERTFTDEKPVDELAPIKLQRKAQVAHEALQKELKGNQDIKVKMIKERRFEEAARNKPLPTSDMPKTQSDVDVSRIVPRGTLPQDMPVTSDDLLLEDDDVGKDRGKAIRLMEETMKKYPEKAKEIQKNLYTLDAFNSLSVDQPERVTKIEDNVKQIAKGNLVYDARNNRLIKPLGLVGSAMEGYKQKANLFAKYDFLKNTENDAAIAMDLEEERTRQNMDEAIPVPKGKMAEVASMIGGTPLKPIVGGLIAGLAGPQAGIAAGAAIGGLETRKLEYAANFQQVYNELRNQGVEQFEAVRAARKQAEEAGEIGTITGAAMGAVGAKFGAKPITTPLSNSFKQAAFNVLKQTGSDLGKAGMEGLAVGGLGAAGQVYKNKLAQLAGVKDRQLDEGVLEQIEGGLLTTVAMAAAIKGGRGLTKVAYKSLLNGLAKMPEEHVVSMLDEKVQNGEITQKSADETAQTINDYKTKDAQIPPNVTEEARMDIVSKIDQRAYLEKQLEKLDKSFHPEIKERIKEIDDQIIALSKQTEKPQKPETGLSKDQEKEATELAEEWLHEGILPDTFEGVIKKDPIGFWKMLAQQAQNVDENWRPLKDGESESAARDQFGDTAVEYAKELFPAPEVKEPLDIQGLFDEKKSTEEIVTALNGEVNDPFLNEQMDKLIPYLQNNPEIKFSKMFSIGRGEAHLTGDWTVLLSHIKDKKALAQVVVHELYHAISINKISNDANFDVQIDGLRQEAIDKLGLRDYLKGAKNTDFGMSKDMKYYGLLDNKEFIAELFSNPEFGKILEGIKIGDNRSIFDRVVDKIRDILGIKNKAFTEKIKETILKGLDHKIEFEKDPVFKEIVENLKGGHRPSDFILSEEAGGARRKPSIAVESVKVPEEQGRKTTSVIQPSEIKQPETITIKPQERAPKIEIANEVDVREPSSDGGAVDERNTQPQIAAREEIGSIQENQVAGEKIGQPPIPPQERKGVFVERPDTQLSFRGLQDTANEFGFEDVKSRDRVTDIQERKNAEITANEWAEKGQYQKNIDALLTKIEAKELVPTAKQRLILEQYLANEKEALRQMPTNSAEYDAQLQKVKRIKDIGQIARQEAGAALRLPDGGSRPNPINDVADALVAKMEANQVDVLTEKQKAEVEAQVEFYKKKSEEAESKLAAFKDQVAKVDAEKEFIKVKSTTKRTRKTTEERVSYRRNEIEAAREALKKLRTGESGLSAVPLPGVRELMAIAPHVKNIMVDLVAQGVDNLQDVVKYIHNEFKEVLEGISEKDIHNIIAGEYNEKKKPLSELQRQVRDVKDEAKYINQLEALLSGKEPKKERAKIERNQKIKDLKDKIKGFREEEKAANKFYGESDVAERKLDKLRDELERIQSRREKEKPLKDSSEEKEISAREKQLRDQIKEAQAETIKTEKKIKSLEEELTRLKKRREKEPKEVNKREISDREKELKEQIDAERKTIRQEEREANTFYKEDPNPDRAKLLSIKKRNEIRAQELKNKIAKGDFTKETKTAIFDREDIKKNFPRLRKDVLDAIAEKEEAQHKFDLALYNDEMAKRNKVRKAFDFGAKLIHTSKAVMAGIDDSASFVQNGLAMLANPKTGAKVWLEHWKDAFSEPRFKRELAAIHNREDWNVIKNSGLEILEPTSEAKGKVEEAFEQNLLAGKIKIDGKEFQPWKYTGGIFERAFTSMGNNFRLSLFDQRMKMLLEEGKTFESHPKEYKDAARAINELTGRGKLNKHLEMATPAITPFLWAPRLLASTMNTLGLSDVALGAWNKGYYQNLTPTQRKFALGQLGRGVAMGIGIMGAAALSGADIDWDPRSVTFGDIKIGNYHYNVFGRYVPVIKALVQASVGKRIVKGNEQDLDNPKYGGKTRTGVVGGFFRGKMTPFAGAMFDLANHRNYFTQEPFGAKDLPAALLTPLSINDLIKGWEKDGTLTILIRFLPAFEGIKVSDERDFTKKKEGGSGGGAGSTRKLHTSPRETLHKNPHSK